MKDPVRDQTGKPAPKYVIANRALIAIAKQIQTFATNSTGGGPRKIEAGVFVFDKNSAREAVKFGPFNETEIENFANSFSNPSGNTPLGNALTVASRAVFKSPLSRKHILIITDGMNTAGPKPEEVLPTLKEQALQKGTALSTHFVAFDVDAKVFAPVKKLDATVVAAADEKQLDTQLQFILQRKILLEEEEPPKKP
jgi:von Willebrand factor type A domain